MKFCSNPGCENHIEVKTAAPLFKTVETEETKFSTTIIDRHRWETPGGEEFFLCDACNSYMGGLDLDSVAETTAGETEDG